MFLVILPGDPSADLKRVRALISGLEGPEYKTTDRARVNNVYTIPSHVMKSLQTAYGVAARASRRFPTQDFTAAIHAMDFI